VKTTTSFALIVLSAIAQEDSQRQLWNTEFFKNRPPSNRAAPAAPIRYKPVAPVEKPAAKTATTESATMLGITLWRMRQPKPADGAGARLLVLMVGDGAREQTPERVDFSTPLANGDLVRLTVESPHTGYLYVVDRERYRDGTTSEPYLIYPNWQTRRGDNAVAPGRLLEIPDRRDRPNCFTIHASRTDQTEEVLSLLLSPNPIPNLKIGPEPLRLEAALYSEWERKWAVQAERFELEGGAGTTLTEEENKAGADHGARLRQDDAPPQTLYRVNAQPGSPMLLVIPLQYKK
jgi:hypothetical protein